MQGSTDQLHGAMHLLARGCPGYLGVSAQKMRGLALRGDGDRVEASVLGDVASSLDSLGVRGGLKGSSSLGSYSHRLHLLSTASRCWGIFCKECKAGRLSTANGLLTQGILKQLDV